MTAFRIKDEAQRIFTKKMEAWTKEIAGEIEKEGQGLQKCDWQDSETGMCKGENRETQKSEQGLGE